MTDPYRARVLTSFSYRSTKPVTRGSSENRRVNLLTPPVRSHGGKGRGVCDIRRVTLVQAARSERSSAPHFSGHGRDVILGPFDLDCLLQGVFDDETGLEKIAQIVVDAYEW